MGAAGLTCSAVEMGAKGDLGVDLDLDAVPTRETGIERLRDDALRKPGAHAHGASSPRREKQAEAILPEMGTGFCRGRLHHAEQALCGEARRRRRWPICRSRNWATKRRATTGRMCSPLLPVVHARDVKAPVGCAALENNCIATPELCSKRWVWEQYDHVILGNTVQRPAAMPRWCGFRKGRRDWH